MLTTTQPPNVHCSGDCCAILTLFMLGMRQENVQAATQVQKLHVDAERKYKRKYKNGENFQDQRDVPRQNTSCTWIQRAAPATRQAPSPKLPSVAQNRSITATN